MQSCVNLPDGSSQVVENHLIIGKQLYVTDSFYFRYPFRIRKYKSSLFILDLHGRDSYCSRLSFPDIKMETVFASRGNGPQEFLSVENIRLGSNGILYILDANKNKISTYNPLDNNFIKQIDLPKGLIRCLDFALISDSLFVIPDYSGKHRFHFINMDGNIELDYSEIPSQEHKSRDVALAQAWRSFIDYNPDNGILAMVTQLGEVLEVFNLKDSTHVVKIGPHGEPKFDETDGMAIPNGIMGYSDVYVAEDKIYALFWGTSFKDIRKQDPYNRIEGGKIIQVFSLEGTPIKQYTLDRHITGFSINEEDNKLIGLDVNSDNPIVEYQL